MPDPANIHHLVKEWPTAVCGVNLSRRGMGAIHSAGECIANGHYVCEECSPVVAKLAAETRAGDEAREADVA